MFICQCSTCIPEAASRDDSHDRRHSSFATIERTGILRSHSCAPLRMTPPVTNKSSTAVTPFSFNHCAATFADATHPGTKTHAFSQPRFNITRHARLPVEARNNINPGAFSCLSQSPVAIINAIPLSIPTFSILPPCRMNKTANRITYMHARPNGIPMPSLHNPSCAPHSANFTAQFMPSSNKRPIKQEAFLQIQESIILGTAPSTSMAANGWTTRFTANAPNGINRLT